MLVTMRVLHIMLAIRDNCQLSQIGDGARVNTQGPALLENVREELKADRRTRRSGANSNVDVVSGKKKVYGPSQNNAYRYREQDEHYLRVFHTRFLRFLRSS